MFQIFIVHAIGSTGLALCRNDVLKFKTMLQNPLCRNIKELNLDQYSDLVFILRKDKHTRIEGLCSEAIFMEDIVNGNLEPVTADFWFTMTDYGYHIRKLITDPHRKLNLLDYRILDGFASVRPTMRVSIAYFDEPIKLFREIEHVKGTKYDRILGRGVILKPLQNTPMAPENERNLERIDKCCYFLHGRRLLKDAAIKRLFANCWLGGWVWDVDAFTVTQSGKIVGLEVKQKYPTKAGTFGLNNGQQRLFRFLNSVGIAVIHLILLKPVNNPDISSIDLLTEQQYVKETEWLFTRFFPENLKHAVALSPAYTSIFGTSGLSYSHIPSKHFATLKKLYEPVDGVRKLLLGGLE